MMFASDTTLLINDAYLGMFSLDVVTLEAHHLINPKTTRPSNSFPGMDPQAVAPLKFFNDLEITPDGNVYFTDSSWRYTRAEHPIEVSMT